MECGASLPTAGALTLHETTGHGPSSMAPGRPPTNDDGKRPGSSTASRSRAVIAGTMAIAAVVVVAFLVGVGARAAYRAVVKTTASGPGSQAAPAPAPSSHPPAAPSAAPAHVNPAKASPPPVATSSAAIAAA